MFADKEWGPNSLRLMLAGPVIALYVRVWQATPCTRGNPIEAWYNETMKAEIFDGCFDTHCGVCDQRLPHSGSVELVLPAGT